MSEFDESKIAIFFYCFETGPDRLSILSPNKIEKDSPGQRVVKSIWKEDGTVYCPRCGKNLIFDGEIFYNNLGDSDFYLDKNNNPKGHLLRYDIKTDNFKSLRYSPPKPGETKIFDFITEEANILIMLENKEKELS